MILAVDIGTSFLKAGILSFHGELKDSVSVPYGNPAHYGKGDFDALQWELAFYKALKALSSHDIRALAISGNGPTLLLSDGKGEPLAPAALWWQRDLIRLGGQNSYYLPNAAWLSSRYADSLHRLRWFFSPPEWLQFRLTAYPTMTLPHAGFQSYVWDASQLEAYGLEGRFFPDLVTMGSPAGRINAEASARTGLPEGLPLAAVGSDFMAALLGSGAVEPGMVCDRAGTSEGINYCTESPSCALTLRDLPHVVEGLWNTACILSSTGLVFEWYRRLTGQKQRAYEETFAEVEKIPAGLDAPLFFPGFDKQETWAFVDGSFHRLKPVHGSAEMGRAVMEAIGYGVRQGIERLESVGMPVVEMRVSGGQARSAVWNQMKADITGCRLLIPRVEDAELVGSSVCAMKVLGEVESLVEGSKKLFRVKNIVEPRKEVNAIYKDAYSRYQEMVSRLRG